MSVMFCTASPGNSPVSSIDDILEMDSISESRELHSLAKRTLPYVTVISNQDFQGYKVQSRIGVGIMGSCPSNKGHRDTSAEIACAE